MMVVRRVNGKNHIKPSKISLNIQRQNQFIFHMHNSREYSELELYTFTFERWDFIWALFAGLNVLHLSEFPLYARWDNKISNLFTSMQLGFFSLARVS